MKDTVAVVGAGTMGAGIAQVAAAAGHRVLLFDTVPGAAERAIAEIRARLKRLVAKGRLDAEPDESALGAVTDLAGLAPAAVVVEAVVEDLGVKRRLFADIEEVVPAGCLLASNTSSLSPSAIAAGLRHPERLVGLHFFNPVPLMRLVEVVPGTATAERVTRAVTALASSWGKTAVRSTPTPGFIVNRVARPFYAEAWRLYEERTADPATIDAVLVGGGFRMGPFALMDLIGHDVNEAVTRSVWAAFGHDPRFAPSPAQRALIESGRLGRKAGRGIHDHSGAAAAPARVPASTGTPPSRVVEHGASGLGTLLGRAGVPVVAGAADRDPADPAGPVDLVELPGGTLLCRCVGASATELAARYARPVVVVDRMLDDASATAVAIAASDGCPGEGLGEAAGLLRAAGLDVYAVDDAPGLVVTRTVAMLVNLAADALAQGVAEAADIDTAMRLGTNHPIGPLEWGDRWGARTIHTVLTALQAAYGDPRYRPSPLLRRRALSGRTLV